VGHHHDLVLLHSNVFAEGLLELLEPKAENHVTVTVTVAERNTVVLADTVTVAVAERNTVVLADTVTVAERNAVVLTHTVTVVERNTVVLADTVTVAERNTVTITECDAFDCVRESNRNADTDQCPLADSLDSVAFVDPLFVSFSERFSVGIENCFRQQADIAFNIRFR
jgi:hypothetical protein